MSVSSQPQNTAGKKIKEEQAPDELNRPIWSVISFDRHEAGGLIYAEAIKRLEELEAKGIAGLCIVTDNAADKIK